MLYSHLKYSQCRVVCQACVCKSFPVIFIIADRRSICLDKPIYLSALALVCLFTFVHRFTFSPYFFIRLFILEVFSVLMYTCHVHIMKYRFRSIGKLFRKTPMRPSNFSIFRQLRVTDNLLLLSNISHSFAIFLDALNSLSVAGLV